MSTATFIGIDLAWKSQRNPTGAAVLRGDRAGARLEIVATLYFRSQPNIPKRGI
jgi:predicted RNase H-like nuclease